MPDQLKVRLVTPDLHPFDQTVDAVEVPARVATSKCSTATRRCCRKSVPARCVCTVAKVAISVTSSPGALSEVLPERVTILAESAQKPEELDTAAVQEQLQHGEKLWNEAGDDAGKYAHANEVIAEAEAKLDSAGAGKPAPPSGAPPFDSQAATSARPACSPTLPPSPSRPPLRRRSSAESS